MNESFLNKALPKKKMRKMFPITSGLNEKKIIFFYFIWRYKYLNNLSSHEFIFKKIFLNNNEN